MMRVLLISRHFPADQRTDIHGTYQRLAMVIEAIQEISQLDVLFYVPPEIDCTQREIAAKEQELSNHWHTPIHLLLCPLYRYPDTVPKWQRHWQGIFDFSKQLLLFETSGSQQMAAFEQCLSRQPDVIFVHRLGAMTPVLLTTKAVPPVIFDLDDIEHLNFLRSLKQLPRRIEPWLYGLQIPALAHAERTAIRRSRSTFVCSDRDRQYLSHRWQCPNVVTIPNTVKIPDPQTIAPEPTLLFLASYPYQPNTDAANFLLEKIWPLIYHARPDAQLIIAGREPDRIRGYHQPPAGVEFTGFVDDLDALYQRSRVVCCPMLSGGGTRIKLVEAAAYGKPIVSTAIGIEGLPLSDGQDCLVRNHAPEFAHACLQLLQDIAICQKLGESARQAIQQCDRTQTLQQIQHTIEISQPVALKTHIPLKVCIVTHNVIKGDGQGRTTFEIAREAIQKGHHVTLVASNVTPELAQHPHVTWVEIPVKGYPTQLLQGMICAGRSAAWLRHHRHEFDIVQVHGANVMEPADVNVAHFVHSSWLRSPIHPAKHPLRHPIQGLYQWLYGMSNAYQERKAFHRAQVIVAVSQKIQQELIAIGIPPHRIQVILNGVDTDEFYPGRGDRGAFGLPTDGPLALFVGDIRTNRKNLDTVLHALTSVADLHLAVVGATDGSPYLSCVSDLQLNSRVHFLGYRTDVADIMRTADFLVFPSRYDPFGMVITEAMACGLPVITTTMTGASELVNDECGIVLSDSENRDALANALRQLASDRPLRHQMGHAARRVAEHHSWSRQANAYLDLFQTLQPTAVR